MATGTPMNVTYYIELYHADGSQILGNGDGQAALTATNYRRTKAYKRAVQLARQWQPGQRVAFVKIVRASDNKVVEVHYHANWERYYEELRIKTPVDFL